MASVTKANGVNVVAGNGLGPNTRILSLSKTAITTTAIADLNAVVAALTAGADYRGVTGVTMAVVATFTD